MPKRNGNGWGKANRRTNNGRVSRTPVTTLRRTFRTFFNVKLNNSTGSGLDEFAYYSKYVNAKPSECLDFRDAQQTFEFWRLNRMRVKLQPGFNGYNISYNTINLDATAAMQCWTAADLSANENISGVSITSYNNARCTSLSLNGITTVANTRAKLNNMSATPQVLLPYSTWLDTSQDLSDTSLKYSGVQLFIKMPFTLSTDYSPMVQIIVEYDVEFKQPGFQNRPTTFEQDIIGSTLEVIPDPALPDTYRTYNCTGYKIDGTGGSYRFIRADGVPGTISYTQNDFWEVYYYQNSGAQFGGRSIKWTGPIPRKPLGWSP
jgi:hypothetical protein